MNMPFGDGALGLMDATSNDVGALAWVCCAAVPACECALPSGGLLKQTRTVKMAAPAVMHRTNLFDVSLLCMGTSISPIES
jgi:hypothetical protein